jgi:hypothetical protein
MCAAEGTPLAKVIVEVEKAVPCAAAVQEHKLGEHDFAHVPGLPFDFDWF